MRFREPEGAMFPWGQIAIYMVILFWVTGIVSGVIGGYDEKQSILIPLACLILFAGSIICALRGISRRNLQNRVLSTMALWILIVPVAILIIKD